jgi:hypothetical protein
MRPVSSGPLPSPPTPATKSSTGSSRGCANARCARHENASAKDAIAVADSYGANSAFALRASADRSTFTTTRQLNVTSSTASNIVAVACFFADWRKRGAKKST